MRDDTGTKEGDGEIAASSPVESVGAKLPIQGARPECFDSTIQEVLFILTVTMAVGINSMTAGIVTVLTSVIGQDLHMSTPEITWISAASSYVCRLTPN